MQPVVDQVVAQYVDHYAGFEISVATRLNERGAYVADIGVSRDGRPMIDRWPETVQPEWRTRDEAVRDAVERAGRLIQQRFMDLATHSWVATRDHAQSWFNGAIQNPAGITFTRRS
jgi:hypothetical protein